MSPPLPEGRELFLSFLTTFLAVTLKQVHLCEPFYLVFSRYDPSLTAIYKTFH